MSIIFNFSFEINNGVIICVGVGGVEIWSYL